MNTLTVIKQDSPILLQLKKELYREKKPPKTDKKHFESKLEMTIKE